ncbi:MAG: hypothetical protein U0361_04350 [Nitrospiraceae bacterium]
MSSAKYRRILLKVSGEMLAGEQGYGIQPSILEGLAEEISDVVAMDVEVAVVIGGGNIFRGRGERAGCGAGLGRLHGHVGDGAERIGAAERPRTQRRQHEGPVGHRNASVGRRVHSTPRHPTSRKKRVVIFAGGTGNPYFSTDTAASLRAMEIGAEVIMKGTKVDGILRQ